MCLWTCSYPYLCPSPFPCWWLCLCRCLRPCLCLLSASLSVSVSCPSLCLLLSVSVSVSVCVWYRLPGLMDSRVFLVWPTVPSPTNPRHQPFHTHTHHSTRQAQTNHLRVIISAITITLTTVMTTSITMSMTRPMTMIITKPMTITAPINIINTLALRQ